MKMKKMMEHHLPLGATTDTILNNLCLFNSAASLEERTEFFRTQTGSQLLHEHGARVALVIVQLRRLRPASMVTAPALAASVAAMSSISVPLPVSIAVTITSISPIAVTVMVSVTFSVSRSIIRPASLVATPRSVVTSAWAVELVFVTYRWSPASRAVVITVAVVTAAIAVSVAVTVTTWASRAPPAVVRAAAARA